MAPQRANDRLADLMDEAGLSNKALARAVGTDHTTVSRWLKGVRPRTDAASAIVAEFGRRLGRRVSLADLGWPETVSLSPQVGIEYAATATEAVSTLTQLWQADSDEVRAIIAAPTNSSAWSEVTLQWLLRPESESLSERPAGIRIGKSDVAALRATTEAFAQLDNRFGGGHARQALIGYLRSTASPILSGRYSESVGRELHTAAAEATLLAAWMSYDAGSHGLAQRYFFQALRLAQAAGDVVLAGSILDAMSHQATFLGRSKEAANLARAARTGTRGVATPTLTAHFYAMEARALAVGGDAVGAQKALGEAVRVYERRMPGTDPEFISYFDDAELSAEFGHCFRDIGRPEDAAIYAERALVSAGASARSDFFVTMVLAAGLLGQGEVEESCRVASSALDLGDGVQSARCIEYLRQFRKTLEAHHNSAAVLDLSATASDHPLWIASAAKRATSRVG